MSCPSAGTLGLDCARLERQARTGRFDSARSCVRYAGALALTVPALAIAVVLSTTLGIEVLAVAFPTLLTLRLVTAVVGAVTLTAVARLAHAELAATPQADAPEELDQIRATRHFRKAVDGRR